MISLVIPTLNCERDLAACLACLSPAAIEGVIGEAIISDGGSSDQTRLIAEAFGARVVGGAAGEMTGRGAQLKRGAAAARGDWLLFLHADTTLSDGWIGEVQGFIGVDANRNARAGVFTLRFRRGGWRACVISAGAMLRTHFFKLPYGDQGLLISRALYDAIGGYDTRPLFEDVDIVERLTGEKGRAALHVFAASAETSPARYEARGYCRQALENLWRLGRYKMGGKPEELARGYGV